MLGEIAYFFRALIEGFIVALSVYTIAGKKSIWKEYIGVGLLIGGIAYVVRLLPIHFGVHTMILLLVIIFIVNILGKIEFYKAASSSIIFIIVLFLSEWITIFIIVNVFRVSTTENIFDKSYPGLLISLMPLAVAYLIIMVIHRIRIFRKSKEA